MTFRRSGLNEVGDVVSVAQAQTAIDAHELRGTGKPTNEGELKGLLSLLEGEPIAPDTVVKFETYEPVGNAGN